MSSVDTFAKIKTLKSILKWHRIIKLHAVKI